MNLKIGSTIHISPGGRDGADCRAAIVTGIVERPANSYPTVDVLVMGKSNAYPMPGALEHGHRRAALALHGELRP